MKRNYGLIISVALLGAILITGIVIAASEVEPNDSPAQASTLFAGQVMDGAINPVGDPDYYSIGGINSTWGFIALLKTDDSTTSQNAVLTVYRNDGITVLKSAGLNWAHGNGIALQNYADNSQDLYFKVEEDGNDQLMSTYQIKYYPTVIVTQPEIEPNETLAQASTSGFTMSGALQTAGDVDCFAFQGETDDDFVFALKADPENNGSLADYVLEIFEPGGTLLTSANVSGVNGDEFVELVDIAAGGVYAYCISLAGGSAGNEATYHAGLVRNGRLFIPGYVQEPVWLNPSLTGDGWVGATLSFELSVTNTSDLYFPGEINLSATFDTTCLAYHSANPAPSSVDNNLISWNGQNIGLDPGEKYAVTVHFTGLTPCTDQIHQGTQLQYYFTGAGANVDYSILHPVFLPLTTGN